MGETPNCFEETTNLPQTRPSASYAAPFLGRVFRYSALKWRFWGYTAQGFFFSVALIRAKARFLNCNIDD